MWIEKPMILWKYIESMSESYEWIGYLYEYQGIYDKSEYYYSRGLKLGNLFHFGKIYCSFLLKLGELYYKLHQFPKSEVYFNKLNEFLGEDEPQDEESSELRVEKDEKAKKKKWKYTELSENDKDYFYMYSKIRQGDLLYKKSISSSEDPQKHSKTKLSAAILDAYRKAKSKIKEIIEKNKKENEKEKEKAEKAAEEDEEIELTETEEELEEGTEEGEKEDASGHEEEEKSEKEAEKEEKGENERLKSVIYCKMSKIKLLMERDYKKSLEYLKKSAENIHLEGEGNNYMKSWMYYNFAMNYLLIFENKLEKYENKQQQSVERRRKIIQRANTAPVEQLLAHSKVSAVKKSAKEEEEEKREVKMLDVLFNKFKRYLFSAYNLIKVQKPQKLTEKIIKLLLYYLELHQLKTNSSSTASKRYLLFQEANFSEKCQENQLNAHFNSIYFYFLNHSNFLSTHHKFNHKFHIHGRPGSASDPSIANFDHFLDEFANKLTMKGSAVRVAALKAKEETPFIHMEGRLNFQSMELNEIDAFLQSHMKSMKINEMKGKQAEKWSVCSISLSFNEKFIYFTRMRSNRSPVVIKLPFSMNMLKKYENLNKKILETAHSTSQNESKSSTDYWNERIALDMELGEYLYELECFLDIWKGIMLGLSENQEEIRVLAAEIHSKVKNKSKTKLTEEQIELYLESLPLLSPNQLEKLFLILFSGEVFCQKEILKIKKKWSENKTRGVGAPRHPVILIIDEKLQSIPWESMPYIYLQSYSRIPSFFILNYLLNVEKHLLLLENGKKLEKIYYLLAPSGNDLSKTKSRFENCFTSHKMWRGEIGQWEKDVNKFYDALEQSDLYVYCGHGSSEKYLGDRVYIEDRIKNFPISLLMGCSSGKLRANGEFNPSGFALTLLLAGSPCVVSYLWDITDRDCDISCSFILNHLFPPPPSFHVNLDQDLLNYAKKHTERSHKTFKKITKDPNFTLFSPDLLNYPLNSNPALSPPIPAITASAKLACYLPFINGAALVTYGLPVSSFLSS